MRRIVYRINRTAARFPWWVQLLALIALFGLIGRAARWADDWLAPYLPSLF